MSEITPCPFVYANGKQCTGHVVGIEAFKVDIAWTQQQDGSWRFDAGEPRSHYHLRCSEKGNHSGLRGEDKLKFFLRELPEPLRDVVTGAARS
jgi:hypothetical protein